MSFYSALDTKKKILFIFLFLVVLSFFTQTLFKGLENSCDLMWQPSKLFWSGINHYEYQYTTRDWYLGCQKGQYGHFLFVFLYPISFLDWEQAKIFWIVVNVFFAISIPLMICGSSKLSINLTLLVLGIFLTCHPTRMTFNLGQNSLMMFFFLSLPFVYSDRFKNFKTLLAGISYVKYSTGYVLFLNFLVEKNFKKLFLSSIVTVLSWLFYSYYASVDLIDSFIWPFKLIISDNYTRTSDVYSILNLYFLKDVNLQNKIIQITLVLILNFYFLFQIRNIKNKLSKLTVICTLPLISLPHSNYDYVLLLPMLIYGLKYIDLNFSKYCIFFVVYYFYFNRIIRHWINNDIIYQSSMLTVLVILLFCFTIHIKKNDNL